MEFGVDGFGIWGLGFRFGVRGLGVVFEVWDLEFRVYGFGVWGFGVAGGRRLVFEVWSWGLGI